MSKLGGWGHLFTRVQVKNNKLEGWDKISDIEQFFGDLDIDICWKSGQNDNNSEGCKKINFQQFYY